ncbi:phage holin family protein [Robiginitalea marina]|uniref:Phage holin family protein n=1 Tax=Robiginitalea marina TaxID=2954105 RepID=A0ABT1AX58_9FLAO|nr:phage holin family protein [Robiginitalea marina]MCO5724200.1 phage holin family protein [Robiginitalea marina]
MAFEQLKEDWSDSQRATREYIDSTVDYYRLRTFKFVMKSFYALALALVLGMFGLLALFFLSIAGSFALGDLLGNPTHGFLMVGGLYVLLGALAFALRGRLQSALLKRFSAYYFDGE